MKRLGETRSPSCVAYIWLETSPATSSARVRCAAPISYEGRSARRSHIHLGRSQRTACTRASMDDKKMAVANIAKHTKLWSRSSSGATPPCAHVCETFERTRRPGGAKMASGR